MFPDRDHFGRIFYNQASRSCGLCCFVNQQQAPLNLWAAQRFPPKYCLLARCYVAPSGSASATGPRRRPAYRRPALLDLVVAQLFGGTKPS